METVSAVRNPVENDEVSEDTVMRNSEHDKVHTKKHELSLNETAKALNVYSLWECHSNCYSGVSASSASYKNGINCVKSEWPSEFCNSQCKCSLKEPHAEEDECDRKGSSSVTPCADEESFFTDTNRNSIGFATRTAPRPTIPSGSVEMETSARSKCTEKADISGVSLKDDNMYLIVVNHDDEEEEEEEMGISENCFSLDSFKMKLKAYNYPEHAIMIRPCQTARGWESKGRQGLKKTEHVQKQDDLDVLTVTQWTGMKSSKTQICTVQHCNDVFANTFQEQTLHPTVDENQDCVTTEEGGYLKSSVAGRSMDDQTAPDSTEECIVAMNEPIVVDSSFSNSRQELYNLGVRQEEEKEGLLEKTLHTKQESVNREEEEYCSEGSHLDSLLAEGSKPLLQEDGESENHRLQEGFSLGQLQETLEKRYLCHFVCEDPSFHSRDVADNSDQTFENIWFNQIETRNNFEITEFGKHNFAGNKVESSQRSDNQETLSSHSDRVICISGNEERISESHGVLSEESACNLSEVVADTPFKQNHRKEWTVRTGIQEEADNLNEKVVMINGQKGSLRMTTLPSIPLYLKGLSEVEESIRDEATTKLQEGIPEGQPSNKRKKSKDDDANEFRRHHFSPQRPAPEFLQWTVAMVRTPFRQQVQNMQKSSSTSADLKSEWKRLATFCHYENPAEIYLIPIAGAGFFLINEVDASNSNDAKVECAFCAVIVVITRFHGRNAMALHAELKPQCRFVRGEDVGNISIAEAAERSGAVFVEKYSIPAGHAVDATQRSLQTASSPLRRDPLAEVLATDSEPTAAEEPARYPLSLPTDKPGSAFFSLPADTRSSQPFGNNDSGRLRDTAGPQRHQQLQRDGAQGSGSRDVGEVVADSRPALAAGIGGSHLAASASVTAPSAGRTEMPYQTATFSTPEPQSSSTGTATPSQTTTANQPASNQTNGPHQTATVSAGPVTSGGTAREAPQITAPGSEGEERSQTNSSGGGTDSIGRSENGTERQLVTYEELGIFSQRPKRPDMAVASVRTNTFEGWPHQASHPKEEMAEAGFYYTGHADLVRCFHCKGGLKTWESSDQPWIEHSRWFPRCPFIKLCKGQKFVQAVQKLNDPDTRPTITESDVLMEIRRMEDEERSSLRADVVLLENLPNPNAPSDPVDAVLARTGLRVDADVTEASMQEVAERLAEENEELTSSTLCKMCQTNEVNVLFLPCGHLVSCAQCAPALRTCAMCRQPVRGSVRVLLDEKRESEKARQLPPGGAAASAPGNSAGKA